MTHNNSCHTHSPLHYTQLHQHVLVFFYPLPNSITQCLLMHRRRVTSFAATREARTIASQPDDSKLPSQCLSMAVNSAVVTKQILSQVRLVLPSNYSPGVHSSLIFLNANWSCLTEPHLCQMSTNLTPLFSTWLPVFRAIAILTR